MAAVVTLEALSTACLASSGALWSVVPCRGGAEKRGWRGPSTVQKPLPHTMWRLPCPRWPGEVGGQWTQGPSVSSS